MGDLENIIMQLESQNQQLQIVMSQKQSLMIQNKELERALEEIDKLKDEDIFKSVGPILVKTKKIDIKKELEETKEDNEVKLKTMESQEKRLKDKIKDGQEKFQELLPKHSEGHGG